MQSEYEAPHIDPDKLDFSIFHPLDHKPFSKRCRSFHGGSRNHLQLLWDFKWQIPTKIRKFTRCRLGQHEYGPWFKGPPDPETGRMRYGGRMCVWCSEEMPETLPEG